MIEIKGFKPRIYQETIFNTCSRHNTLTVLPTGTGKTLISIMLAVHRLNQFANSKVVMCSPTKPLCVQHVKSFRESTNLPEDLITLYTGVTTPAQRKKLWDDSLVIIATPQTIQSDIESKRISLKDVTMLCIDEAHRSRMRFANTIVAKAYMKEAVNPRVLALTASPGGTKEKIDDICENLSIEKVEIRTKDHPEMKKYIQEKETEWVSVELPAKFKEINKLLKESYKERLEGLKNFGVTKPPGLINKRDLILLQKQFVAKISEGSKTVFWAISLISQAIKLSYTSELIETQGLEQLNAYFLKLSKETSRAAKSILYDKNVSRGRWLTEQLLKQGVKHPKMHKLKEIIGDELSKNPSSRIIIFANFRNTVEEIVNSLKSVPNARPTQLVGQKEGLTQKEQAERIDLFANGDYNVMVATCVAEEGIDVIGSRLAVFYDIIPSEIRKIQRMGRVGRTQKGKVIFLITKNSREEAYRWSSYRKEKIMEKTLKNMQDPVKKEEKQSKLTKF